MKISITMNGFTATVTHKSDDITLDEMLEIMQGLLVTMTYSIKGKLKIVEEEYDRDEPTEYSEKQED